MRRFSAIALGCALIGAQAAAAVPLTPAGNGHLVAPVFVNGKGTLPFVVDTGADGSYGYEWFARQQGLEKGEPMSVEGMTGAAMMTRYRIASISLDGRTIHDVEALGLPDRKDAEIEAGVIGNDLMDGALVAFDFPCRTITVTPKPVAIDSILNAPAEMVEGKPVPDGTQLAFTVRVNGVSGTAILDTGSRGTEINPIFAQEAGIEKGEKGDTLYGAAGRALDTHMATIERLSFGGHTVSNVSAKIAALPVFDSFGLGEQPAMIFGMNAMAGLRLLYDHEGRRFWFDRSRCEAQDPSISGGM